jgi:hypothetical protein
LKKDTYYNNVTEINIYKILNNSFKEQPIISIVVTPFTIHSVLRVKAFSEKLITILGFLPFIMTWKLLSLGCLCRKSKSRRRLDCGGSTVFKLADELDQEVDLFSFDISVEASDEQQCVATGKYDEMSLLSNKNSDRSGISRDKEQEEADEAFLPPALNVMIGKEPATAAADENESSYLRALANTTTAVAVSSLASSLGGSASAKNSSCASSTSSTSFLIPPPPKPPIMTEASSDSCPKNGASEEIESVLSQDQGQVLIVSSFSSTYAADDTEEDMPMDELHHWRENPRPPKQKQWIVLPPPPPPLPPPPPPQSSPQQEKIHHNIIHDDTNDSMDADIESFQAKNNHKGDRRGRSTSIATRRSKSTKSSVTTSSSYLSQSQGNNHTSVSTAATSTKQPLLQTTIKPWYSLSSASPKIDKINVRPKEFISTSMEKPIQRSFVLMEEGHPTTISPSISSSDGSFTSDPFSDLSSFASTSKASSSNHGIVVIVSDEDEDEDDVEPHDMLYHHSFRVLGTTTTSYAEGDEDKYDVLSYNFNKVLSTTLMKYLKMFLPPSCSQDNFWLKYSLVRDVRDVSSHLLLFL